MKNIRKFETTAEMESAVLTESYVLYNEETGLVYTNPNGGSSDDDYSKEYLTFVALEDGTFSFTKRGTGDDIQYTKDNGSTWTSLASGETVSVVSGDKVMWKSTITPKTSYPYGIGEFSSSNNLNVYGNIVSLLYGDDFKEQTSLEGKDYAFYKLFKYCSFLIDASNLILPATTLADFCYGFMFDTCFNLTTVPELPATTLADSCYSGMFRDCTILTTAPELPATTLNAYCYNGMFEGCISLTTAPELPATTLVSNCYYSMFRGCTNLTTAPELPATTLAEGCCYGMFEGCTSLTTAPELPATTLARRCYYNMFSGCTNLNHITMLATKISASGCLTNWAFGVSSTGTFVKHTDMESLPTGASGIPNGWTVEDAVV